jgi:hypothetical protein
MLKHLVLRFATGKRNFCDAVSPAIGIARDLPPAVFLSLDGSTTTIHPNAVTDRAFEHINVFPPRTLPSLVVLSFLHNRSSRRPHQAPSTFTSSF